MITYADYIHYSFYEPQLPVQPLAGLQFSRQDSTLDVMFDGSGNVFSFTTDYPGGDRNFLPPTGIPSWPRHSVTLRFWAAIRCEAPGTWALHPARINIYDVTGKRRAPLRLRRFVTYSPATLHPRAVNKATMVEQIDMGEALQCAEAGTRAFSANLEIDPSVDSLAISCDQCLSGERGRNIQLPEMRLEIREGRRYNGIRERILLPAPI